MPELICTPPLSSSVSTYPDMSAGAVDRVPPEALLVQRPGRTGAVVRLVHRLVLDRIVALGADQRARQIGAVLGVVHPALPAARCRRRLTARRRARSQYGVMLQRLPVPGAEAGIARGPL